MSKEPEPKCDLCDVVVDLYCHEYGWRCPTCMWSERVELRKILFKTISYLGPLPGLEMIRRDVKAIILDKYPCDINDPDRL